MKQFQHQRKSNDHQLQQMICAACRVPIPDGLSCIQDLLMMLLVSDRINLPIDVSKIFEIKDKIPVLVQVGQKNSPLVSMLTEQPDCAGLFVDSLIPGREGLFLAKYMTTANEASQWVNQMIQPECIIRHIAHGELVLAASFLSFVNSK